MRFRIDLKIFIFVILFFLTRQIEIYAITLFFAIIHEFGHLLAGLCLGMKPKKLEIMPFGVSISFEISPKDYNYKIKNGNLLEIKKIIVALAGPVTNLVMIFIVFNLKLNIFTALMVIYSNFLLMLFNLLPIYPLDGGRIIRGILHILFGKIKAEKYVNYISFTSLIVITFVASIIIYQVENIAIFLIVLVLWMIFIKEDRIYRKRIKIYNLLEKSLEIK